MALSLFQEDLHGVRVGVSPYLLQRRGFYTREAWRDLIENLKTATTVYVGNLSFYTTEEQIYELFTRCGAVKRVIMGLNKKTKTPCGFCFVEYYRHQDAEDAQKYLSGSKLDERVIRADVDPGFEEGRQYGRSKLTGGQVRDEHRTQFDPGRGGWAVNNTSQSTAHTPHTPTTHAPTTAQTPQSAHTPSTTSTPSSASLSSPVTVKSPTQTVQQPTASSPPHPSSPNLSSTMDTSSDTSSQQSSIVKIEPDKTYT